MNFSCFDMFSFYYKLLNNTFMKDESLHKLNNNDPGHPNKVYNEELHKDGLTDQGAGLFDTEPESEARDAAKIEKSLSGTTQKMDSVSESNFNAPQENASALEREAELRKMEEE